MIKRDGFTLIEFIVVIIVLGILATYTTQMLNRDIRSEAINHILSIMRYTQNLALHDKKHNRTNAYWQRSFWRFEIKSCGNTNQIYYSIGTDETYTGGLKMRETALDPSNGKYTYWTWFKPCPKNSTEAYKSKVSPNIFLTQRYGISSVASDNCKIWRKPGIGFDNYGRPIESYQTTYTPNYFGHLNSDCTFTFTFQDSSIQPFQIVVTKESGYIYLKENPNL